MPFVSEKQRRFMHAKHPEIARRWEHEKERNPLRRRALKEKRRRADQRR